MMFILQKDDKTITGPFWSEAQANEFREKLPDPDAWDVFEVVSTDTLLGDK